MDELIATVVTGAPNLIIAAYVVYRQFEVVEKLTSALIECVRHCPEENEEK